MSRAYRKHKRAVTLVELLIGIMITSMVALGVASMLYAASYGTSSRRELRRLVVRCEQVRTRMDDAIRNASTILAEGTGYIVLWTGDARQNDQVNLSELQLIELADGSDTLMSYTTEFPAGWSEAQKEAADTAYPVGSNFASVAQTAKAGSYFPGSAWAKGISNFNITLDNATATQARMVTWNLTLTDQLLDESLVGTASPREHVEPQ